MLGSVDPFGHFVQVNRCPDNDRPTEATLASG